MKIRCDFVSNSSSSSFICAPEDASNIALFNESEVMNLHEYLEKFGFQDFINYDDYYLYDNKSHDMVKFVDNETFCKMFATGIAQVLPLSAKDEYKKQIREYEAKKDKDHDYWLAPINWSTLLPYVEDALSPVWGSQIFEYVEAEDSSPYKDSNEESYLHSIFYNSHMKFQRIFCNH